MNLCPHSDTGRRNDQKQGFRSRLEFDNTIYKSATEALEAYIAQFKGGRSTTYRRRPSDLLSPAPKYYFMDSLERRLKSPPSKSPARKVDELLEWVNVAYAKELSSKVSPFGYRTTPELPGSDEENMNPHPAHGYHSHRGNDDDLSTLPSPSSSVVDLDSNAGTVETEVLMSSYKGIHTSASGSYSNMAPLKSPPKLGARPDGSTEYPSWVSGLGKEYPSWVEDLDRSIRHRKVKHSPDTKYSSSSSSTSASETRKKTSMRPSRSTPALKVSDLQKQTRRPQDPPRVKMAESRMNGTDWNDAASTDTDMLVSQSVYGPHPVNMGGDFHNSLYQDKIVARLKKESTKKLRKSTGKVKSTEHSTVSSRRSKSRTFTPTKTLRFSARDGEQFHGNSENKKSTPVRTGETRESSPEGSPFTALPARYSLPPQNERYRISEEAGRRSASPPFGYSLPPQNERYRMPEKAGRGSASPPARYSLPPQNERYRISEEAGRRSASPPARYSLPQNERYRISEEAGRRSTSPPSRYSLPPQNERYRISEEAGRRSPLPPSNQTYISPPAVARYSQPSAQKLEVRSSQTYASASASKSPSRGSMPLKINIPEQREDSDVESEDTDRVMRKSPTGIKMEKMYRDPNTMYPWKTMIQSSRSQNTSDEFAHSKPQYHSTPMVYAGREPPKSRSSAERQHYSEGVPRGSHRSQQRVAFSEARSPHRDRQARTAENFKLTPKAVFASSSYRSRDEKLAKSAPNARYSKPPPVPRSSGKNVIHRRSKTVPDLRRIAISSATAPRHSRRSLDDDVISVNTADTETLITRPPMPVFYVSPSLTTVSDSETLVESETETETELDVARPRHLAAVQHDSDTFSPTSVFASTNPHAAVREELPERFHLWKLDEDTKAPDSFIKRRFTSPKSGIISAFLEDCLSVDSDDPKLAQPDSTSPATRLSGKEAAPGPVEALKQMLFTMQDMAHHETLDNGHYYQGSSNTDFKSREVKDPSASDDQSEIDLDVFGGEVSLQRAYHHLERLKRLVGREDDQSSTSSAN